MAITNTLFETVKTAIVQGAVSVRNELELTFVIPVVESAMRLWYHLDPRIYRTKWRIKDKLEGRVAKKSDTYVLLVLFARYRIPVFTQTLLDAIARSDLNLIIVSNGKLTDKFREELLDRCHLLIERANLGRDFGAYKDGIAIMNESFPDMERLILMNDSLFYFEKGLDEMLRQLRQDADLIGVTETFEHHYHIQSFMLSFSRLLMDNKRFRKYWRNYRPISTRRWAIHKGEVGFTKRMMKSGIRPLILYHGAALFEHLRATPPRELLEAVRYLPSFFRNLLYKEFLHLRDEQMETSRENIKVIGKGIRYLQKIEDAETHDAKVQNIGQMLVATKQSINVNFEQQRWELERFVERIVNVITSRNQGHVGGFLFMKYLGMPFMKRDVFYREVYTLPDIFEILTDFREPLKDAVMSDLRQKGSAIYLKGIFKVLYRHGSI